MLVSCYVMFDMHAMCVMLLLFGLVGLVVCLLLWCGCGLLFVVCMFGVVVVICVVSLCFVLCLWIFCVVLVFIVL